MKTRNRTLAHAGLLLWIGTAVGAAAAADPAAAKDLLSPPILQLDIASQPLADALNQWAQATGFQLIFPEESGVPSRVSAALHGRYAPIAALERLLQNSGLSYDFVNGQTVAIRPMRARSPGSTGVQRPASETSSIHAAQADRAAEPPATQPAQSGQARETATVEMRGVPEILIFGSKTLNMDVVRSRDDIQPYTVFDRNTIETSGAANLNDFLRQRLTANTSSGSNAQSPAILPTFAATSSFNLRGLGEDQTLILIDGHRVPDMNSGSGVSQPDVNNIPLAAIERVEVLATTSSGIYGGSATGGVINIILRRNYTGAEAGVTYDNSFASGGRTRRADFGAGFNLTPRTNLLVAASLSESDPLRLDARDLVSNGIAKILANNPRSPTIYGGSPPVGSTPNIRDPRGANLVLKNGTSLGSPITFIPPGYAGTSDGGAALIANAGQYNLNLSNDAQIYGPPSAGGSSSLLAASRQESVMATLRHAFESDIQAFLDVVASNTTGRVVSPATVLTGATFSLPASAPNNPFQQDIDISVPFPNADDEEIALKKDRRLVGGVIVPLPGSWSTEADITWQQYDVSSRTSRGGIGALGIDAPAAISSGALDVMRDPNVYPLDLSGYTGGLMISDGVKSTLKDYAIRASGPLRSLPAGSPRLAAALERRDTEMSASQLSYPAYEIYHDYPSRSQKVTSAYLEARIPLLAARHADATWAQLELQVAGRYDRYETDSAANTFSIPIGSPAPEVTRAINTVSSTNPTIALRYQPLDDLVFRASYGTGFTPPSLTQLVQTITNVPAGAASDPKRGGSMTPAFVSTGGGNEDLKPEDSKSWSIGTIITPTTLPGLRASIDYLRIRKTNNIAGATAGGWQSLLDAEELNPGRVTRGPSLPGDPPGWAGPVVKLDFGLLNMAKAAFEGVDVALDYRWQTAVGTFNAFSAATRTLHYQTQVNASMPVVENVAMTLSNPLKIKANGGLEWSLGNWSANWMTTYYGAYITSRTATVVANQGNGGRVPSQMYHDLTMSYRVDDGAAGEWLRGISVQLGIRNIFDKQPPFDANSYGVLYSTYGDPRGSSYYVTLKKAF